MPPAGFEPAISASERPKTHALDRAAAGAGFLGKYSHLIPRITPYVRRAGCVGVVWFSTFYSYVVTTRFLNIGNAWNVIRVRASALTSPCLLVSFPPLPPSLPNCSGAKKFVLQLRETEEYPSHSSWLSKD